MGIRREDIVNYYFLLEDEKSFIKVLPSWLEYCGFRSTRVADITEIEKNNYVMQSGQGVTQLITKVLFDTINTILSSEKQIDKLVIIVDAENKTIDERRQEIWDKIHGEYDVGDFNFEIKIIVCNRCFETWLLGAQGYYPNEIEESSFFNSYYLFYNIEKNDPEQMLKPSFFSKSIAQYHFQYLHEMFRYNKIGYQKKKPRLVATEEFFGKLIKRIKTTSHINSFAELYNFILNENNVNS